MENKDNFLKFKNLLDFVFNNKYSDFYRTKYEQAGFNPADDFKSIDDVKKIPFLTKKELLKLELFKRLFIEEREVGAIAVTSGTTGEPFVIFYHESGIYSSPYFPELVDEKIKLLCLSPNPPMMVLFYHLYGLVAKKVKEPRAYVGDASNLSASCRLAEMLKINVIYTFPSLAIVLKNYLEHYPGLKKSLKCLMLVGEVVTPEKKKFLKNLYPNLKISLQYSSNEGPGMAFQCRHLAQRGDQIYYHTRLNDYYLEIVNPETGERAESGEKGELVMTNFWNSATPLIRYRTGDLISFAQNDCPCGVPGPLLQHWGRADYDMVKAGGFVLRTEMLEKPLLNLKEYVEDAFEAHIYEKFIETKPKVKIILDLSLKNGVKESAELKQKIENEFLANWRLSPKLNFREALEAGLLEPIQVNFVKFRKSPKTQKKFILH